MKSCIHQRFEGLDFFPTKNPKNITPVIFLSNNKAPAERIPGAKVFDYKSALGHTGCARELLKAIKVIEEFLK